MKHLKINTFLLTLLLSMAGITAAAHDIAVKNKDGKTIYYKWTNNNTALAVSYGGTSYSNYSYEYSGNVVIPESVTYNGATYPVTSIYASAFYGCTGLTSVTIPNSVTSIYGSAFYGCSGLTSVTIPNSVTSIGGYAFDGTAWYNNQPDGLVYVGKLAYKYKGTMPANTSISLLEGTLGISECAFEGCSGLSSVTIPNSVTSIGGSAFSGCSGLTSVTIPNSVTSIGNSAFYGTAWYNNQPDGVVYAGKVAYAYKGTMPANTSISLQEGTLGIAGSAFSGCSGLTSATIPNSVTSIGNYAFYNCSGLTSVTVPNSVTSIGSYAFSYCSKLESVTIGTGVLTIGSDVFYNHKPTKVIWLTNTPPSGYSNAAGTVNYVSNDQYTSLSNQTVYALLRSVFEVDGIKYVPVSLTERTCAAIDCLYDEGVTNVTIGETALYEGIHLDVTRVHEYTCHNNTYIKSVELGLYGDVKDYAFQGCTNLGQATINNSGNVGNYAFQGCLGLSTATLGESVTGIGDYAFDGCTKLKGINLPDAVTNLGQYAFQNCSKLKSAKIGAGVKTISTYAFNGCSALAELQVGEGVATIQPYTFNDCSSLASITLPQSVESVSNNVFKGCSQLRNVIMADWSGSSTNNATTLGSWTSTNTTNSSTSSETFTFEAESGSTLSFNYSVSSEDEYDMFVITLDGTTIIEESGEKSGTYTKTFTKDGSHTLVAKYTKDDSGSGGSDQASITDIVLTGVYDGSLTLGSNDSGPLFADCPLDSVYIGRNISYETGSNNYSPFYQNTSLRAVMVNDEETEISEKAFYGCTNLKNVYIGDGVTTIGDNAFSGCTSLNQVAFGCNVETIGEKAFFDCTTMTLLESRAETPPTCGSQALQGINKWDCKLRVPEGSPSAYQEADQWDEFFYVDEIPAEGGDEPVATTDKKCATPTISYLNWTLHFDCETEGVTYHYRVYTPANSNTTGNDIKLSSTVTIKVYATKYGYKDSDEVTADIDIRGLKGDVNGDGVVSISDAVNVVNIILGNDE